MPKDRGNADIVSRIASPRSPDAEPKLEVRTMDSRN